MSSTVILKLNIISKNQCVWSCKQTGGQRVLRDAPTCCWFWPFNRFFWQLKKFNNTKIIFLKTCTCIMHKSLSLEGKQLRTTGPFLSVSPDEIFCFHVSRTDSKLHFHISMFVQRMLTHGLLKCVTLQSCWSSVIYNSLVIWRSLNWPRRCVSFFVQGMLLNLPVWGREIRIVYFCL